MKPIQLFTERELSGELSFGEYGIRRLKQDIGPPKATPERLTRAKQNVDWLDDNQSLRPRRQFFKPYRDRFSNPIGGAR